VQLILGQFGLDSFSCVTGVGPPNFLTLTGISLAFQQERTVAPLGQCEERNAKG
jgi:hypothetical protein